MRGAAVRRNVSHHNSQSFRKQVPSPTFSSRGPDAGQKEKKTNEIKGESQGKGRGEPACRAQL